MKRSFLLVFILCTLPFQAYGHPGKTDRYGGHKCLKGCEEWGLYYEEYHKHDKDGKPIRVSKKKNVKTPEKAGLESDATETVVPVDKPKAKTITINRYVTNVYEESLFLSNPLIYILLLLLLLLLILRMNRKREEG